MLTHFRMAMAMSTTFVPDCRLHFRRSLRFSGDRALETLVKRHAEMTLFVKHVADKQQFPVFL